MEEIIDFVNTIRPGKLYSIALPDTTNEKAISDYFFGANGKFKGFHLSSLDGKNRVQKSKSVSNIADIVARPLVLRKRKSFNNLVGDGVESGENSSCNESDSDSDLNFGGSEEDDEKCCMSFAKKFKS